MSHPPNASTRYIGLDIHKHYALAIGVDAARQPVFGPHRVSVQKLESWVRKHLTRHDHIVMEMTTNTYLFYDVLKPRVASVIAVHPPHVKLIVGAKVKTDKKAATALAQLHAVGLLEGVWMPPQRVRDLRALVAQRDKMVRLSTIAKNRLHAVLHRTRLALEIPEKKHLFTPENRGWWENLPLAELEKERLLSDLDTLEFAQKQVARLEGNSRSKNAQKGAQKTSFAQGI